MNCSICGKEVRAKVKYAVIYRHRDKHPIGVMCEFFHISRSGYYSCVKRLNRPEKDAAPAEMIRRQQEQCFHTYGCRRMWQWLKSSEGVYRNPKTILRIMKKYGLLAEIRRRRRWRQPDSPAAALDSYRSIRTYDGVYTDFGTHPHLRHKPATFSEANEMIDRYIHFYNHQRIQHKTGVAPLTLRHSC